MGDENPTGPPNNEPDNCPEARNGEGEGEGEGDRNRLGARVEAEPVMGLELGDGFTLPDFAFFDLLVPALSGGVRGTEGGSGDKFPDISGQHL